MLRDLVIVGAGPVGATLALALADSGIDALALDSRAEGTVGRGDRSLALSHGARLIFERLGVWSAVAAAPGAVTPITAIDISQRGGFGHARLDAAEQGLPALGYVVSYRALQGALDAALARSGVEIRYDCAATRIGATPAYATIEAIQGGAASELTARLVALADGGGELAGNVRRSHDYGQVALVGKLTPREPHRGVAFERFTPEGPMALLPLGNRYGLVWTTTPAQGEALLALPDAEFLDTLRRAASSVSPSATPFRCVSSTRAASSTSGVYCLATPRRRCILSPGRASTSACAMRTSWRRSCLRRRARRSARVTGSPPMRAADAPTGSPASRSRMGCWAFSEPMRRYCRGRAGWRSLCSTPFPP